MNSDLDLRQLPGSDLVSAGIADLAAGVESQAALLVSIGATNLRAGGLEVTSPIPDAERRLYRRLQAEHGDEAHARYNALVQRLTSFENALAHHRAWRAHDRAAAADGS